MYELSNKPKQLKIYGGAYHGTNMFLGEDGDQIKQDIVSFIEDNLPAE